MTWWKRYRVNVLGAIGGAVCGIALAELYLLIAG